MSGASAEERAIDFVKKALDAQKVEIHSHLQALWSGQGHVFRLTTNVPSHQQVVVKYIAPTDQSTHPRGWNTSTSYKRKLHSYQVESHWYTHYACRCTEHCKVPVLLGLEHDRHTRLILLEDLAIAYPYRPAKLTVDQVKICLRWLAEFHALFLIDAGDGLWPRGCYWHLATRQDEWQAMKDSAVKRAASWLDERLQNTRFQTLVHGDAKLANFCFDQNITHAAAVDFQYVGKGCGMSDVVYLLGSCLSEQDCERYDQLLLDAYFSALRLALARRLDNDIHLQAILQSDEPGGLIEQLETQWRALYAIAWTDFYRFLSGWMPGHAKINRYTKKLAEQALQSWPGEGC